MMTPPRCRRLLWPLLTLAPGIAAADVRDDIGYPALRAALGRAVPAGAGVPVALVEGVTRDASGQPVWLPDVGRPEFAGQAIANLSNQPRGGVSGHATAVASIFFGRTASMTPRITTVSAYSAPDWTGAGYLQATWPGTGLEPVPTAARVANHSWIGDMPLAGEVLRRVDWAVATDEFIQVVGTANTGANQPLLASAYNVIAVGRTMGSAFGSAGVDTLYTAARARPDLVVPADTTSAATPFVASAAALLIGLADASPRLSTDPRVRSTRNRAGTVIWNAGRSEVVRAALMAGADRRTANRWRGTAPPADIRDYRLDPANQADNGLDLRYGAGQLNVYTSYRILAAGEQNSAEDDPGAAGRTAASGFDYDPHFGGAADANAVATYRLPYVPVPELRATLVWNLEVDSGRRGDFTGPARLHNLDLRLWRVGADGSRALQAASTSTTENTESLWLRLPSGFRWELEVVAAPGSPPFDWDYALAWHLRPGDRD
jgi:hypothetical protein